MKTILYILFCLQLMSNLSFGQDVSREQLNQEIAALKEEVFKATEVFLNASNDVDTRVNALEKYPFVYDEGQISRMKLLLLNERELPVLRSTALNKLLPMVPDDEVLIENVFKWVQNVNTPKELREEALNTLKGLSFSGFATFKKRQDLIALLRTLTKDSNSHFREFAFNFLLGHGDSYAQSLLIDQLKSNRKDLLPTAEMLRLLSLWPKGDYLPTVYKIFQNPPDKESKIESMILLGNYTPAKKQILTLLKDKKQPEDVRSTALSIINANYPVEFSAIVQNMIVDETETEKLRVTAIVMETYRRKSNQEKAKRKGPDEFDKNVERLKSNPSPAIRRASESYSEEVRPEK